MFSRPRQTRVDLVRATLPKIIDHCEDLEKVQAALAGLRVLSGRDHAETLEGLVLALSGTLRALKHTAPGGADTLETFTETFKNIDNDEKFYDTVHKTMTRGTDPADRVWYDEPGQARGTHQIVLTGSGIPRRWFQVAPAAAEEYLEKMRARDRRPTT